MDEDAILAMATCRMLMIESPADQIPLPPPPPASETEGAVMWHPADRPEEMERIPLSGDEEKSTALLTSIWLGGQVLELSKPDVKVEEEEQEEQPPESKERP